MITYNHEKYIRQAIEGILQQAVDFEIELIIADDHSTDDTQIIVQDLIKNHPNGAWIKYTKHPKNKGMTANFIWALGQSTGHYIALCEGDDFWTHPLKLHKQVGFLSANPEYVLSFHNAEPLKTIENNFDYHVKIEDKDYNPNELFLTWAAPTGSCVFSSICVPLILEKLKSPDVLNPDLVCLLACVHCGKSRGIKEKMSVYRIHEQGISYLRFVQDKIGHLKKYTKHYQYIGKTFPLISKSLINVKLVDVNATIAQVYYKKNDVRFIYFALKCLYYKPYLILKGFKKILKPFR